LILAVLILTSSLFLGGIIVYAIIIDENRFEWTMALTIVLSFLGILSSLFQFKTIKFYKSNLDFNILEKPSKLF